MSIQNVSNDEVIMIQNRLNHRPRKFSIIKLHMKFLCQNLVENGCLSIGEIALISGIGMIK